MSWYPISTIVAGIVIIGLASFVYLKNRRALLNKRFALIAGIAGYWCIVSFFINVSPNEKLALIYTKILNIGAIIVAPIFTSFTLAAVENKGRNTAIKVIWIFATIFLVVNFTPLLVKEMKPARYVGFSGIPGPAFPYFILYYIGVAIYGTRKLFVAYKHSVGYKRNQLKYLLAALLTALSASLLYFLLSIKSTLPVPPVDNFLGIIFVLITAYAIVRHRIMDINVVITRAGIFILVYGIVLGIPLVLGYHYNLWLWSTWLTLLLASSGPFVYNRLRIRAENILLKEQRQRQETLKQASKKTLLVKNLNQLLDLSINLIIHTFDLRYGGIYLFEKEQNTYTLKTYFDAKNTGYLPPLAVDSASDLVNFLLRQKTYFFPRGQQITTLEAELIMPLYANGLLIGIVFLSEKPLLQVYSPDDLSALEILMNQTSIAIENILSSQERDYFKSLGILSAGLAHEIKTPLTAIKTFGKYLPSKLNDKQFIDDCTKALALETERINKIVEDLLDFANPPKLNKKPIGIVALVNETISSFRLVLKEHHIALNMSYPQEEITLLLDKERFKICISNLISNAIDAMENSKVKNLSICIVKQYPYIIISVRDTGKGISRNDLPYIFNPFYTTKDNHKGIGLAMTKSIVEQHGGFVEVESGEKGICFRIGLRA
jgi:signal transduction histidine kinase